MTWRRRVFGNNLRSWLGWRDPAEDVREEMELHLELRRAALEARGLPVEEAQARAQREVGNPQSVGEHVHLVARRTDRASALRQRVEEGLFDLRLAVRVCRAAPGVSAVAVLTIAAGLGANAAIFALVNTLFFRPLPFDPERTLVRVREYREAADGSRIEVDASRHTADVVAARTDLFTSSVPMIGTERALLLSDGPVNVQTTRVGPRYTDVVHVKPMVGRSFSADEDESGAPVAMISHRLWRSIFGARPSAIGEKLRFEDGTLEVVGVLPPAFHVPYGSDIWFPSRIAENERGLFILARTARGVTMDQLLSELASEGRRLNERYPELMRGMGVMAVRARDYFVDDDDRVAMVLMGAVGFLLMIACANVALLLTTRFASRRHEVAVRAALGCGRGRQIRQFVTEAVLLFGAGGGLGLAFAVWLKEWLVVFLPEAIALEVGIVGVPLDLRVVSFALGLSLLAGLLFGLVAALRATRSDVHGVLKEAGRSMAGSRSAGTMRALAVVEIALALVLLASAGTLADTFRRLQQQDLGLNPDGLLTVQASTSSSRYADGSARLAYVDALLERVRRLPGVQHAAVTTVNPLCCGDWGARASVEGHAAATPEQLPIFQHQLVSSDYFTSMGIPIVKGRPISAGDRAGREPVVVVDERAARRFWPGQDPIGKRVRRGMPSGDGPWLTVVGVAGTIEDRGEYSDAWYLPLAQHPAGPSSTSLHLMVRAADPLSLVPSIKAVSAELDPVLALHDITTMNRVRDERLEQGRLGLIVTIIFAGAGLLLAALGLYGVLSFVLAADRKEFGVRLALGAPRASIATLVVVRGARLTVAGVCGGLVLAFLAAAGIERLFDAAQVSVTIIAVAAAAVAAAALVAAAVPAIRASRLDVLNALRG